jgi:hypothetical protein
MKIISAGLAVALALVAWTSARANEHDTWAAYLDYAYVYSSADRDALASRLDQYGAEAGQSLDQYIIQHYQAKESRGYDESETRREAIAYLLDYLSRGEPDSLEKSEEVIRSLEGRLSRHENRYWYHYILAHDALRRGRHFDFVGEVLDLWLSVVVPLENPYEALQTLALDDSPSSGFAAALPYVYENVARLILLKSPEMGVDTDLDPLGAVVRLLADGRVGAHPDVIPPEASSQAYLERIVTRLDGPESDAGSLTFTLALFEASKYHDQSRARLASDGLEGETVEAIRVASGAYEAALDRADTVQGEAAVYTRALRQLGEIYAAKQRLGVDPEVVMPFTIEGAIDVYAKLHKGRKDGWRKLGYRTTGRRAYIEAMRALWEEIQESTLNASDYYLDRAAKNPHLADEQSRNAARLFARYLTFFSEFATDEGKEGVPESAYFAAHEAARGVGDAYLAYAMNPRSSEIDLAIKHYRVGLKLFPFDRRIWSALTHALERQGRESDYMELVRPAAESVTRSRSVDTWIDNDEPGAERIGILRRAFSDSLALMYLGFADASGVEELRNSLEELHATREETRLKLAGLTARRDGPAAADPTLSPPASPHPDTGSAVAPLREWEAAELGLLNRQINEASALLERMDNQIQARSRTIPLYEATLTTDGLSEALRSQRDHPLHTLLRRMYHETRQASPKGSDRS